ncbi:MAG: hypothetical protein O9319_06135 [Gemmatimonas sp.]|nr:hypothetical protein [Gemmatimonas sp.]MCA2987496.1 hypothetical protein [Gemmatimonas sp.]MCZ8010759.1 hypothetical protein [Gemmatimonas sp.]MCZ8266421.1 hypothetical protein [Gemmatimonas sp.]
MRQRRADIMVRLDALLADNAVFVLPTVPDLAPLLRLRPADPVAFRERALALLCIAGLGGLPKVTLPFGTLHGRSDRTVPLNRAGTMQCCRTLSHGLGHRSGADDITPRAREKVTQQY